MRTDVYVVAVGDPFNGLKLYGPYTQTEADDFIESKYCRDEPWNIIELRDPGNYGSILCLKDHSDPSENDE